MKIKLLFFALVVNICLKASTPRIQSFTSKQYEGHQSNYDALFDKEGNLYVANPYGVLIYNGNTWKKIPLPFGKSPVSLCFDANGKLFVGGDNELGYLEKSKGGIYSYHSLVNLFDKKEIQDIGWVNYCAEHEGKIYFASEFGLYIYDGTKVKIIKPENGGTHAFIGNFEKKLFVIEEGKGVYTISEEGLEWFKNGVEIPEFRGIESISLNHHILYGREGIYELKGNKIELMSNLNYIAKHIISDVIFRNGYKYIATEQNGLFVLGRNMKLKHHLNTYNSSIADNYIYQISINKTGDLSVATNNGISIVNFGIPLLNIGKSDQLSGAGYSSLLFKDTLYLGTSQGLYYNCNWSNGENKFEKLAGTKAFIYDIFETDGEIFLGDQSDVYQIVKGKVTKLSTTSWKGAWCIKKVPDQNILLVGTYYGIDVYRKQNGKWKYSNKLEGYNEAGRTLEFDEEDNLWACSGLTGLYKLKVGNDFQGINKIINMNEKLKVRPDNFIELCKNSYGIYVSSYNGLFFIKNGNLFKDTLNNTLKFERIRKVKNGTLYTVENKKPIILTYDGHQLIVDTNHVLNNINIELIGDNEMINEISKNNFIVGTAEGFAMINNSQPISYFGEVKFSSIYDLEADSIVLSNQSIFSYQENNLRFSYSFSVLEELYDIEWYTSMTKKGDVANWKKSDKAHYKEFTNLFEGDYEFQVKAVSRSSNLGEQSYYFTILPPWYRSRVAKSIYFILFLVLGYTMYRLWIIRVGNIRKKLNLEKERELLIKENEHRAKLLNQEIKEKETEISYLALNYSQKIELLKHVSGKLNNLMRNINNPRQLMTEIKSIKFSLNDFQKGEEQKWTEFQIHFNSEHNDFVSKIKEMDPKIKESNLLMCTYVRMGKTNKEICDLLNLSINALDKRKSRLKERFGAPEEITFNEYVRNM